MAVPIPHSLGGTLFYPLTGQRPSRTARNLRQIGGASSGSSGGRGSSLLRRCRRPWRNWCSSYWPRSRRTGRERRPKSPTGSPPGRGRAAVLVGQAAGLPGSGRPAACPTRTAAPAGGRGRRVGGAARAGWRGSVLEQPGASPSRSRRGEPSVSGPRCHRAGRAVRLSVTHFVEEEKDRFRSQGVLGEESFTTHHGDSVTGEARLSRPAYAYPIAFRPDGTEDVFSREGQRGAALYGRPRYPSVSRAVNYGLTDGEGLEVFALVVSSRPPPSYKEWLSLGVRRLPGTSRRAARNRPVRRWRCCGSDARRRTGYRGPRPGTEGARQVAGGGGGLCQAPEVEGGGGGGLRSAAGREAVKAVARGILEEKSLCDACKRWYWPGCSAC